MPVKKESWMGSMSRTLVVSVGVLMFSFILATVVVSTSELARLRQASEVLSHQLSQVEGESAETRDRLESLNVSFEVLSERVSTIQDIQRALVLGQREDDL